MNSANLCKKLLTAKFVKNNQYNVQFVPFWDHLTIIMCNYGAIMSFKTPKRVRK